MKKYGYEGTHIINYFGDGLGDVHVNITGFIEELGLV
jgi:hypothetical protein